MAEETQTKDTIEQILVECNIGLLNQINLMNGYIIRANALEKEWRSEKKAFVDEELKLDDKLTAALDEFEKERKLREYYQSLMFELCRTIDRVHGSPNQIGHFGTPEEPNEELFEWLKSISSVARLVPKKEKR